MFSAWGALVPVSKSTASLIASADSDDGLVPSQHLAPAVRAHATPVPLKAAATTGTIGRPAFFGPFIAPVP
ncbi:MAG: hypothetical protein ABI216_07525 [Devosia sp.]